MLHPVRLTADALGAHLAETYLRAFGNREPEYAAGLDLAARLVIERIGNSDALYHNVEHTLLVTLVGQDILHGRILNEVITPGDWRHFIVALLAHDIGYVRGICRGDTATTCVIDAEGHSIDIPRGASDAFLTPYHVDRSKLFVRERLGPSPYFDEERLTHSIELTRFPVPDNGDAQETASEAALVRAADLIGQLADPFYLRKLNALFHEFTEIGAAERFGYTSPADLADKYPRFYWSMVAPYLDAALRYLELTVAGKQWVLNLYGQVFATEHKVRHLGPQA